ncbi:PD-(D/E)XK nuclease family transposase [Fibrobacter sp. UWOV1]|uniref:PD-(D/E)XK nuclease family transposase n=1 Tax=Fibrobacter sp. UWOV1 TaxID=1896215 RepID=UPI000915D41B|nr:PD-(D/E)XK nuclease family transposase [Fibrobacter sp. UWOV1]SHK46644.1 PD-(D/E)XK nuclease family transposase [Fibrobacter sp. UWOV1]
MSDNTNHSTKKYIVTNEQGEEFLLPKYAATFRILMDDKDTIRDVLNSLLQLDHDHEIIDLEYEFEKPIDIFMPENDPARLDVWVHTRDNRYMNIEMQNKVHAFFFDRMQLYNSYLTLRGKYEFNRSDYFLDLPEEERKYRYYELPETVSIWLCNNPVLRSKEIYKDVWSTYSEYEVKSGNALPISRKNRYIVVDLPNFLQLRKGVKTREDFWLRLISRGPLQVPETEDPIFANALDRLRVSRMNPELLKALEANMFDRHEYEALEAEAFLKGAEQEREKNDADNAARDTKRADYLRSQNVPDSVIAAMLALK